MSGEKGSCAKGAKLAGRCNIDVTQDAVDENTNDIPGEPHLAAGNSQKQIDSRDVLAHS